MKALLIRPYSILALLILLAFQGCGREDRIRGRTYDFLAHLGDAEVLVMGTPVDPLRFFEQEQPWTEDPRLFCPAPRRTSFRFKKVPFGKNAELEVGMCLKPAVSKTKGKSGQGIVTFEVELQTRDGIHSLLKRSYDPALLEPGEIIDETVPLPESNRNEGAFVFRSDSSQGMAVYHPMWCGLRLLSDGRPLTAEETRIPYRIQEDLLFNHPGPVDEASASGTFRADFVESDQSFEANPEGRFLLQEVPAASTFLCPVPQQTNLTLGLGIATPSVPGIKRRDLLFQVLVDGEEVFRETVSDGQGRYRRCVAPLPAHPDSPARIVLKTSYTGRTENRVEDCTAVWTCPLLEREVRVPRQEKGEGKNIVLMVVDTLRADHLSCYGYERLTSPNLDRLAAGGALFETALAQSSWTIPSTASILTGQYSYTHGLYDANHWYIVPGIPTLPEVLQRLGITTAAFVSNPLVSNDNNFSIGFETFQQVPNSTAAQLNRTFLNWLDDHGDDRFFAYLHYMDPHAPYGAPGAFLNRYGPVPEREGRPEFLWSERAMEILDSEIRDVMTPLDEPDRILDEDQKRMLKTLVELYDSEIFYWDHQFGLLTKALEERGLLEDTLLIITSDHGEEFLDHGMFRHGQGLFHELLHVPLIFLHSGHSPGRFSGPAGLIDVTPTVIDWADARSAAKEDKGIPPPPFAGMDLFSDALPRNGLFAETAHGLRRDQYTMHVKQAVVAGRWKGIATPDDGMLQLFDLERDRREKNDLSGARPDVAAGMAALIDEWVRACRNAAPFQISSFNAGAVDKLRQMGYLK